MTILRRVLTISAWVVTAAALASADSIVTQAYYGSGGVSLTGPSLTSGLASNFCLDPATASLCAPTDFPRDSNNAPQLSFIPFDPSLGILNSIIVKGFLSAATSGIVYNNTTGTVGVSKYDISETMSVLRPGDPLPYDPTSAAFFSVVPDFGFLVNSGGDPLDGTNGTVFLNPGIGNGLSFSGAASSSSTRTLTSASTGFNGTLFGLLSSGNIPVTFGLLTQTTDTTTTSGGNLTDGISTSAFGAVQVTYDFTPASTTPEPTTMALLGGALLGLGLAGKRFRKN